MLFRLTTIRARLFQLLIIAMGSLVLATVLVWQFSIEPALRLSVAKGQREIAQRAAEQIGGFIDARVRELEATAEIGRFWEEATERHKQAIYRLFKLAPEVHEVSLVTPDGHEQIRVSRLRVITDDDLRVLKNLQVFQEAIRGQVSIGRVYQATTSEPYLSIAIPVKFTATDIRGVLKAEISLKSLWDTVSHIRVGQAGHLYVVNRKGELIGHPDYSKVLLGLSMAEVQEVEEFLESPDSDPGFGEVMRGEGGARVMSTYSNVPQTGWGVIVQEPLETALAEAWKLKRLATIVLVLAVAGAFLVSYRFSRRVSDPVRDLEKGAELIARGNLDHRLVIRTGDEIESLAEKFNGMAQSLKESYEGLEGKVAERTREISSLYAALAPLRPGNSLSETLEKVIERLVDATGAGAALIRLRDRGSGFFFCPAAAGFDDSYLNATRIIRPGSAVETVFLERRPIISPDIASDQRLRGKRQLESGFLSCAFVPLEVAGEIRGVIHLASRTRGFFTADKEPRLMAMARQMSVAIENHDLFAQTQRRQQQLQALYTITETVTRSLDPAVLAQAALVTALDVLKLGAGRLYVYDEQDERLRLTAHHGIPVEHLEAMGSYAPGTGIIGMIFQQKEALIFPSVRDDPPAEDEQAVAAVGLPIAIKDRVIGVIDLYGGAVKEFDSQDMELLSAIGRQVGTGIENARLFQESVERARQQEALNAIAAATSQSLDLAELFEIALDKVLEVTGRERVSIRLRDGATGAVTLVAHRGFTDEEIEDLRHRTPHRMSEQVFASGEPIAVNESARDGDPQSLLPHSRSVAWIPMKSRAKVVGVLGISATRPNPFSRREVDFLLAVGNVIGVALENVRLYENERSRVKSLRLLVNASQKLIEQVDIDALAQDILDTLVTSFGVRLAWIGSAEPGGRVRPLYWSGDVAEYLKHVEIRWDESRLGHGPAGRAIRSGQPVVMDVATDAGFAPWRDAALANGYREVAAFPLIRGAKPFGHLILYSSEPGCFTPERVELVQTYANIATGALENARLFQETQRNLTRIRALHEIDKAIASSLDLNVVLKVLLEQIEFFLPCPASSTIRLFDRATGLLEPVACRNLDAQAWKAWKGARGTANAVYQTKAPLMIPNVQADPRTQDLEFFSKNHLVSYLGVPLIMKDEALGVLGFYTREERPFSQEEVEFLVTLGGQAAIAIHNSQLYGEIQKQAVELQQSNKVKDEFLSVMSHELRTPLIAIMGYAGLMEEELMGKNSPEQAKAIGVIKKESEHLLAMIREILEATRLESGAAMADKQPADVARLLAEIEDSYRLPLGKPVVLHWRYDSCIPVVCTDVMKLKQILQNLIANAIKFTEEGSVTVSARHSIEEKAVCFEVADTGVGIPSEMLPLIFDKFRQVDSSDTRSYEGVGLGLFIAKKFSELLGGTIRVRSEPGRGSTFTVILPCGEAPAAGKRLDDCVNL